MKKSHRQGLKRNERRKEGKKAAPVASFELRSGRGGRPVSGGTGFPRVIAVNSFAVPSECVLTTVTSLQWRTLICTSETEVAPAFSFGASAPPTRGAAFVPDPSAARTKYVKRSRRRRFPPSLPPSPPRISSRPPFSRRESALIDSSDR